MLFCNTTHHAARLHVSTLFANSTLMNKPPPVRQQDVLCANYIVPDSRMRQVVLTHIYVFPSGDDLWPWQSAASDDRSSPPQLNKRKINSL